MTEKLHQQTSEYILDKDKQKDHIHKLEKETLQLRKSWEDNTLQIFY
jgi:hypothetical protein